MHSYVWLFKSSGLSSLTTAYTSICAVTEGDNVTVTGNRQTDRHTTTDIASSEHNSVSDIGSPSVTTSAPSSENESDHESELIRPRRTRTTRRPVIDSESSASGGDTDDEDIVVLSDGCRTQEARLVGRQRGGTGAATRLPSPTSPTFRYNNMILRERREVGPTEQLPEECKYNINICYVP